MPAHAPMHDKPFAVRLPGDLAPLIEREAKAERLSVSDIIRRILLRHYGLLT